MCIRDSRQGRPHRRQGAAEAGLPALGLPGRSVLVDLRRACLLYTSDAADERSSVDLGGRRIIKKKNNESEHSGSNII